MIRRLFMALLVLCLALPAMAPAAAVSPHCDRPASDTAATAMEHGNKHHPAPQRPGHDCIGCAMPARAVPPLTMAPFYPREPRQWNNAALPAAAATPPDTPPPRA
ncbi:MAG: hypothetical protein M0R03_00330 [Novosphingobium sp.]|nr:hypothetical protein [Novosphingobium sp.]